ncbi:hypothetical protein BDV93DRAFT_528644 [Ceratobasidium sp. AG-I]|nr:hypothetical protein BDV93DRAFT_528644 [Ceratobasidium sp. AG-I]
MNGMTEEEFYALALARGFIAPPAASSQQTTLVQPAASTQPVVTGPPATTAHYEPATSVLPAPPPWIRRSSLPSRPLAATRPSSLSRPTPLAQSTTPTLPSAPFQPTTPALSAPLPFNPLPAPAQPVIPAQPTISTSSVAPAQTAIPTRSIGPDRPVGPARAARQAASDAHLTTRPLTGAGAPAPRKLSSTEVAELQLELSKHLEDVDRFEIKYASYPGGRKTTVKVKKLLDLSDDAFKVISKMLKIALGRTPGIDMTLTIKKQASNYLIMRAIHYVLPLLPGFEIYKDHDYWPLECIASRLFRNGANVTQNKKRTKIRLQAGDKANPGSGDERAAEHEDAPTVEQVVESQANFPARPEAQSLLNSNVSTAPGLPAARSIYGTDVLTEDDVVANVARDLGNMSVDPTLEQAAVADQEAFEPFTLPPELTGAASTWPPALIVPPPILSTPVRIVSQPGAQLNASPISINSTATATATSQSIPDPTSAVATMVTPNPVVAPQTPARQLPAENGITPGLLQRLLKIKDSGLTDAQINHFPAATRATLLALRNLKPGDTSSDAAAVLAALPASNISSHLPGLEDDPDGASSGLSEPEHPGTDQESDPEDMEVDGGKGTATGGQKGGRGTGKSARGRKKPAAPAASGSGRATRSKADPGAGGDRVEKPKRAVKPAAAPRAEGNARTTSAPAKPKTTQKTTTTTKKKKK